MGDKGSSAGKGSMSWLLAGILLGLTQVAAVWMYKPLGVSTQFVVADARIMSEVAPGYAGGNELLKQDKYQELGHGWWLVIGLVIGAFIAALSAGRWKLSVTTAWWRGGGRSAGVRLLVCFAGGFLVLFGARLAHGCTSGQFASGWAQLSLSAVPFTVALLGFGMLTAAVVYRGGGSGIE